MFKVRDGQEQDQVSIFWWYQTRTLKAKRNITIAKSQLAGQEVAVGRYYLERNNPLSAINRFKTVIDDHKSTPYYPEALFRLIEGYAMLGINHKVKVLYFVISCMSFFSFI